MLVKSIAFISISQMITLRPLPNTGTDYPISSVYMLLCPNASTYFPTHLILCPARATLSLPVLSSMWSSPSLALSHPHQDSQPLLQPGSHPKRTVNLA